MAHNPNAFENQIFHYFREQEKEINKAIQLLNKNDYTIINPKGKTIKKDKKKEV